MSSLARSVWIFFLPMCGAGLRGAQPPRSSGASRLDAVTIQEMLRAHNQVRSQRELPPLRWSLRLEALAHEWAVHLSELGALEHDHTRRVGQNLFASWGSTSRPAFVVSKWADESKDYDERRFRCASGHACGHFTQLIWRDTREVGCGVARRGDGEYWVCYYSPPGNFIGEHPY